MFKLNRAFTVLFHACVWSVLLLCVWLWRPTQEPKFVWHPQLTGWFIFLSGLPFIALFYLNAYWLIPEYFSRKKKLYYFLLAALGWLITVLVAQLLGNIESPPPPGVPMLTM